MTSGLERLLGALTRSEQQNRSTAVPALVAEDPIADVIALLDTLRADGARFASEHAAWNIAEDLGLDDLQKALSEDHAPEVAFVGAFNAGKSTVINSLLDQPLAAEDDLPTTARPTRFRHGPSLRVTVRHGGVWRPIRPELLRAMVHKQAREQAVDPDAVRASVEADLLLDGCDAIDVTAPSPVLSELVLVDTPGFHSGHRADDEAAFAELDAASACVWVADIQKGELTEADVRVVDRLTKGGQLRVALLNKAEERSPSERKRVLDKFVKQWGSRFDAVVLYSARLRAARSAGQAPRAREAEHLELDWEKGILQRVRESGRRLRAAAALRQLQDRLSVQLVELRADSTRVKERHRALEQKVASHRAFVEACLEKAARDIPRAVAAGCSQREGMITRRLRGIVNKDSGVFSDDYAFDENAITSLKRDLGEQSAQLAHALHDQLWAVNDRANP